MKRANTKKLIATLVAATMLVSGIANAGVLSRAKEKLGLERGTAQEMPVNTVTFADRKIARKIHVASVQAERTAVETVKVDVLFYNTSKKPMRLAVRNSFFDENRVLTEKPGAWRTLYVQPRSYADCSVQSTTRNDVASFLVEVQGETATRF